MTQQTHDFNDPSGDDTISDPSGDDVNLSNPGQAEGAAPAAAPAGDPGLATIPASSDVTPAAATGDAPAADPNTAGQSTGGTTDTPTPQGPGPAPAGQAQGQNTAPADIGAFDPTTGQTLVGGQTVAPPRQITPSGDPVANPAVNQAQPGPGSQPENLGTAGKLGQIVTYQGRPALIIDMLDENTGEANLVTFGAGTVGAVYQPGYQTNVYPLDSEEGYQA